MENANSGNVPVIYGLTMSSLEIAGLMGKRHDNVLRDADKMLVAIGLGALSFEASYLSEQGKPLRCLNLPKRECLILVSGYSVELRARIIDRWLALETAIAPTAIVEDLSREVRAAIGGIVKGIVHKEISLLLPTMVEAKFAEMHGAFAPGVTAGEVIEMAGIADRKGLRGLARLVSDRMRLYSARKGATVKLAELGMSRAFVFDVATAREWLLGGGKAEIEKRVAERRGQRKLHLVGDASRPSPGAA